MTILDLMMDHHRQCDEAFAKLENQVGGKDWSNSGAFEDFHSSMTRHFQTEETVFFTALEKKLGGPIGPTMMMRQEHQQMSILLEQMRDAFTAKDREKFLSISDTWMMITQQHNMKEEEVLYPMLDEHLEADAPALIDQAQQILK